MSFRRKKDPKKQNIYLQNCKIEKAIIGDVINKYSQEDDSCSEEEDDDLDVLGHVKYQLKYIYKCSDNIQPLPDGAICTAAEDFVDVELREVSKKKRKVQKQPIQLTEIFCSNTATLNPPSTICLEGESGYGKTSVVKKIAYDWASLTDNANYLKQFELVFLVNLGNLKNGVNLLNYIEENLILKNSQILQKKVEKNFKIRKFLYYNAKRILFILDGLDTISHGAEMFKNLRSNLPESTILITQKPIANECEELYKCFEKNFVIQGFKTESIKKYIHNFFIDDDDNQEKAIKCYLALEQCEDILESSLSCPLFLYVFCDIFKTKVSFSPKNLAEVIEEFFSMEKKIYVLKRQDISEEEGYTNFENVMKSLGKIALENIKKSLFYYTAEDVSMLSIDSKEILEFGFLKGYLAGPNINYHPTLKIFNEFLAAFYISSHGDDKEILAQLLGDIFATPQLCHAKSKKGGSKASTLVLFIIHLLKDKSYLLFQALPSTTYEDFSSLCQVLIASDLNDRNIEVVMNSRISEIWDTGWFFKKSNELNEDNILILTKILTNPECPVNTFIIDTFFILMLDSKKDKYNEALTLVCSALAENTSIEKIIIQRDRSKPALGEEQRYLSSFDLIFRSLRNISYIMYDLEIADSPHLCHTLLINLFEKVQDLPKLVTLKISSILKPLDFLCDSFHTNVVFSENRPKKNKGIFITDSHITQLLKSLSKKSLQNLFLPQLQISKQSIMKLTQIVKENPICHLSLTFLKLIDSDHAIAQEHIFSLNRDSVMPDGSERNGNYRETSSLKTVNYASPLESSSLVLLFNAFLIDTCNLSQLNLKGRNFSLEEICALSCFLQKNETIKSLNLANCINTLDVLNEVVLALKINQSLQQVNLSSSSLALKSDDLINFCSIWYDDDFSRSEEANSENHHNICKIKEMILSGWEFTVNEEAMKITISALFSSSLKDLCLREAKIIFQLKQSELIICNPMKEMSLEILDIRNVAILPEYFDLLKTVCFTVGKLEISHSLSVDSGFAEQMSDESFEKPLECRNLETIFQSTKIIKSPLDTVTLFSENKRNIGYLDI